MWILLLLAWLAALDGDSSSAAWLIAIYWILH